MTTTVYSISAVIMLSSSALLLSLLFSPQPCAAHLWPKPLYHCHGDQTLRLSENFEFVLPKNVHRRLTDSASLYRRRILNSTFVSPVPSMTSTPSSYELRRIFVQVEDALAEAPLGPDTDESYRLLIAADDDEASWTFDISKPHCAVIRSGVILPGPQAYIRANTIYGAMHAFETFAQLIVNADSSGVKGGGQSPLAAASPSKSIPNVPVVIHDRPLFPHRGILVDTSRNFLSMATLRRTVDAMAMNKMNVLHWHLIDSHSFPLELDDAKSNWKSGENDDFEGENDEEELPLSQLTANGAYSSDMVYHKDDITSLVTYALDRGIRIIPEVDMPGHAWVWSTAFPEITTCLNGPISFAAEQPTGQLNPVMSKTYRIVDAIYEQVIPLFVDTQLHSGGDEIKFKCWNSTKAITDYLDKHDKKADAAGFNWILNNFVTQQHKMIRGRGKAPIIWEEAVLNHNLPIIEKNKDTIIQVWTTAENIKKTIQRGYKVITGSADYWYLDCGFGSWVGGDINGNSWCDPYKTWQKIYSFNPLLGLTEDEAKNVLGGETLLWGELVDDTNVDAKLWPRSSAAAEVLWSGNSDDSLTKLWDGYKQHNNTLRTVEALDRINEHRFRMLSENIPAEPLMPM
ncbi:hypothetical protein BG000_004843, partial [Podila horticola]